MLKKVFQFWVNCPVRSQFCISFIFIQTSHKNKGKITTFLTESQHVHVLRMLLKFWLILAWVFLYIKKECISRENIFLLARNSIYWNLEMLNYPPVLKGFPFDIIKPIISMFPSAGNSARELPRHLTKPRVSDTRNWYAALCWGMSSLFYNCTTNTIPTANKNWVP